MAKTHVLQFSLLIFSLADWFEFLPYLCAEIQYVIVDEVAQGIHSEAHWFCWLTALYSFIDTLASTLKYGY
jgi:hypothetical protein